MTQFDVVVDVDCREQKILDNKEVERRSEGLKTVVKIEQAAAIDRSNASINASIIN